VIHELEHATLAAVVDWAPETASAVGATHGVPWFVSLESLLEEVPCDAIVVATPDFLHFQPAMRALVQGRHVLVEKPLATSVDEARTMVEEASRRRRILKVNYSQRLLPEYVWMKEQIEEGAIGSPVMAVSTRHATVEVPTRMLGWAAQTSPVFFMSSHDLDVIGWLFESWATRVVARERRGVLERRGIPVHDGVDALITYASGAVANLHASWIHPDSTPTRSMDRLTVIGDAGAIHYESRGRTAECYAEVGGKRITFTGPHTADEVGGRLYGAFRRSIEDFLVCVRTGVEPETAASRTLNVTETQVAIIESISADAPVAVGGRRSVKVR
jgi:predicted dehydrogenase